MPLPDYKNALDYVERVTDKYCPLCTRKMKVNESHSVNGYYEFDCSSMSIIDEEKIYPQDHFYVLRVTDEEFEKVLKVKLRLDDLCLRINFDDNTSEIWVVGSQKNQKVTVPVTFFPSFNDPEKIKQKIRTLLTFS